MLQNFLARLTSRKFLMTIFGVILILILKNLDVPDNVIVWIIGLIGGWIGVEGLRDIVAVLKKVD